MAANKVDPDRKAKIMQMQRQAQAAERRRTIVVVGSIIAIIALISGAVTYSIVMDKSRAPEGSLASQGVPASAAACDPVTSDPATGSSVHVGPNTDKPTVSTVKYSTVPPTSGEHFVSPEYPNRQFYSAADRPKMETLVHNLEHGYSILWYTDQLPQDQIGILKAVTREANKSASARNKFIVSAWDPAYGTFPAGKQVAVSHWAADPADSKKQVGHRLMCGKVSGEAIASFIKEYPYSLSPEPNAQ